MEIRQGRQSMHALGWPRHRPLGRPRMEKVEMAGLVMPQKCKIVYMKGIAKAHSGKDVFFFAVW